MNTEITENIRGYVFYDAACPLCRRWIRRIHRVLIRRGLHPVPLQAAWAKRTLGLADGDPLVEMKLLTRYGAIYGGADALVQITRAVWWLWPLFALAQIPGAKTLLRAAYLRLAANRPCDDGQCELAERVANEHRRAISAFFELP